MKVEEVCAVKFIETLSVSLRDVKKITRPAETEYIKTGHRQELSPTNPDWYYIRVASVLRRLYTEQISHPDKVKHGFGTMWFARVYGGAKNNGHKPSHTVTGSKSLVRRILQSLETHKLVSQMPKGGRALTPTGVAYLEEIAGKVTVSS
jgi:small subunit ribosomal protein S19e